MRNRHDVEVPRPALLYLELLLLCMHSFQFQSEVIYKLVGLDKGCPLLSAHQHHVLVMKKKNEHQSFCGGSSQVKRDKDFIKPETFPSSTFHSRHGTSDPTKGSSHIQKH